MSKRGDWPRALDSVLAKALAKCPADRYPSCGELAEVDGRVLADDLGGDGQPPRPARRILRCRWQTT